MNGWDSISRYSRLPSAMSPEKPSFIGTYGHEERSVRRVNSKIGLDWSRLGSEVGWVGGSRRTDRFGAIGGEPISEPGAIHPLGC